MPIYYRDGSRFVRDFSHDLPRRSEYELRESGHSSSEFLVDGRFYPIVYDHERMATSPEKFLNLPSIFQRFPGRKKTFDWDQYPLAYSKLSYAQVKFLLEKGRKDLLKGAYIFHLPLEELKINPEDFRRFQEGYAKPFNSHLLAQTHPNIPGSLENAKITLEQYQELRKTLCLVRSQPVFYRDFQGTIIHDFSNAGSEKHVVAKIVALRALNQRPDYKGGFIQEGKFNAIEMDSYPLSNVKLTGEQLKALIALGHKDFRGAIITDQNLEGLDLTSCDFTDAYLRGSNLTGCTGLTANTLVRANLRNVTYLQETNVMPDIFRHVSNRQGLVLRDLSGEPNIDFQEIENFEWTKLSVQQFKQALDQGKTQFNCVTLSPRGSFLENGIQALKDISLQGARLDDCVLGKIRLENVDFSGASLLACNADGIEGRALTFDQVDAEGMTIKGSVLKQISLAGANLSCANLTGATIDYTCQASFFRPEGIALTDAKMTVSPTQFAP